MAEQGNGIPGRNLVAIDVARYWNAVLVETAAGKRHRFKMANTAADFGRLLDLLESLPGTCQIGLEPTGDYHGPIAHRLLARGHDVVSINSVALARYRMRCSIPGTRTIPRTPA
jgi:transposase